MNFLDSECSSGCESGWTRYLEQSCLSPNASHKQSEKSRNFCRNTTGHDKKKGIKEEEDEDLSMVSDASSGPPLHFHEDHDHQVFHVNDDYKKQYCFFPDVSKDDIKLSKSGNGKKGKKMKNDHHQLGLASSFLDDTASSPVFNFSKSNNLQQDFTLTSNQGSMESFLDYSQGFSVSTHFQGRPAFQDPCGSFLHSSPSGNQTSSGNERFEGY